MILKLVSRCKVLSLKLINIFWIHKDLKAYFFLFLRYFVKEWYRKRSPYFEEQIGSFRQFIK